MYKLETHTHSNIVSNCSRLSAEKIIEIYCKNGYNGIIVTEHFLNSGSNKIDNNYPNLSYKEKVEMFYDGYLQIKELAKGKLDVFFGFEYGYKVTDILVYGWDKEKLLQIPQIMQMSTREFIEFANDSGALTVHAHPFREAHYIDHIRLFTQVQGVEVYNACRTDFCNEMGELYAKKYNKYHLAGSDIHYTNVKVLTGLEFEEKVQSIEHFISLIRQNKGKIFKKENVRYED